MNKNDAVKLCGVLLLMFLPIYIFICIPGTDVTADMDLNTGNPNNPAPSNTSRTSGIAYNFFFGSGTCFNPLGCIYSYDYVYGMLGYQWDDYSISGWMYYQWDSMGQRTRTQGINFGIRF